MYFAQARYYDYEVGRFNRIDPIRDGGNWYVYVGNNPVSWVDFTGLYNYGSADMKYNKDITNNGAKYLYTKNLITEYEMLAITKPLITEEMIDIYEFYLIPYMKLSEINESGEKRIRLRELNKTLYEYEITTPEAIAMFMGNVSRETLKGYFAIEHGENVEYGGTNLYNGSGYIQLTHEYNYKSFARYIYDIEDVKNTKIMLDGKYEVSRNYMWSSAGWFWKYGNSHKENLSTYANKHDWITPIYRINSGEIKNIDSHIHKVIERNKFSNEMYFILTGKEFGLPVIEEEVKKQVYEYLK